MKKFKSIIALAIVLAITTILASGCNTLEGLGEDVEQVGNGIQDVFGGE